MKVKRKYKGLVIGFLLFLVIGGIVLVFATGYFTFTAVTRLSTNEATGMEHTLEGLESIGFDYDGFCRNYRIESVHITSTLDGHDIPGHYIYSKNENADTIIMIHGVSGSHQSIYPAAQLFLEKGYHVLAYDQRSTGENTAEYTTFGYLESCDTADCVSYLDGILDSEQNIYIWGCSMGAATAGISARHEIVENRVAAVILDSPFSSAEEIMQIKMERMKLGIPVPFMIFCGSLYNRIALGFSYGDASAARHLAESGLPVLIIASKADDFTQYWMAEKLKAASPNAVLVPVEDSAHAEIFFDHPGWYADTIMEFINHHKK